MAQYEHNSERFGYINLETMEGVQTALQRLDLDPGEIDGLDGPRTRAALRQFQKQAAIRIDGVVGPETRQALMDTLNQQASEPTKESESQG